MEGKKPVREQLQKRHKKNLTLHGEKRNAGG